jgi:hypothetical protein
MRKEQHLKISGILFTVILILWPVFMAIAQPYGLTEEQLSWVLENIALYKVQFFLAFLISPSILYLMFSQLQFYPTSNQIAEKLGLIFLAAYLALNCISYGSQMIVVPAMLRAGFLDQAWVWYFNAPVSIPYFLNQMGYFFWAMGTLALFVRTIKENGMIRYLSIIYVISAVLSIIAFAGLIVENPAINSLTMVSGMILIPTGVMTVIWGNRIK